MNYQETTLTFFSSVGNSNTKLTLSPSVQSSSINFWMRDLISAWSAVLEMSQTPVSIARMGMSFKVFSHSQCLSCTFLRQSRGIPSSPSLFRCLILFRQSSGEHLRQMMALRGQFWTILEQIQLQISYSASSRLPQRYMIQPKTWRSARGDLSEKRISPGCSSMAEFQRRVREWRALSWKVKAHRLGSQQQFLRMLPPAIFSHQSTGYLITEKLKRESRVLLPAPKLPSIEITPDINVIKPLNLESNQTPNLNYKSTCNFPTAVLSHPAPISINDFPTSTFSTLPPQFEFHYSIIGVISSKTQGMSRIGGGRDEATAVWHRWRCDVLYGVVMMCVSALNRPRLMEQAGMKTCSGFVGPSHLFRAY